MADEELVTVDVVDGWLVCPPGGQQTGGTVTVPADLAAQWVGRGWAVPAPAKPTKRKRAT